MLNLGFDNGGAPRACLQQRRRDTSLGCRGGTGCGWGARPPCCVQRVWMCLGKERVSWQPVGRSVECLSCPMPDLLE